MKVHGLGDFSIVMVPEKSLPDQNWDDFVIPNLDCCQIHETSA